MSMVLLRNGEVYGPRPLGKCDLLLAGGKIIAMGTDLNPSGLDVEIIDLAGKRVLPGFVDGHTHLAGAGGEGGPATRTPELQLSQLIKAGVTTVVGCLGTDGITRTPAALLMKARGIEAEGLTARVYTGSYQVPPPTICGEVAHDICYVDAVIGVGEVAHADGRSSGPTALDLARLAKKARVAGLLAGKPGLVHIHMGDEPTPFSMLYEAVRLAQLPHAVFFPTHINRNRAIFQESFTWAKRAPLDITAGAYPFFQDIEIKPATALAQLLRQGVPIGHICMSSDAGGSLPHFENGQLKGLSMGLPDTLLGELKDAVEEEGLSMDQALPCLTTSPADVLGLPQKGRLAVDADADLITLDQDWRIQDVFAGGTAMQRDGELLVKGTFE